MCAVKGSQNASSEEETLRKLEATVERATGQSAETLRNQTLSELRRRTEGKIGHRMKFQSLFPLVGRGNVMRDRLIDHESVEAALKHALR
jgi:hypothetical protein